MAAMFERFNEPARRSLFFARYEASVLGSRSIETEHLLLGILRTRDPFIMPLLGSASVTAESLQGLINARVGTTSSPLDTSIEIPFSEDAKQVLECTVEEADRLLHREIGPEHVLLGLLRVERGLAWDVLREQGFDVTTVRAALVLHVGAASPPPPEIAGLLAGLVPGSTPRPRRAGPIYVMTALDGQNPGRRLAAEDDGSGDFMSTSKIGFTTRADRPPDGRMHSIGPISMRATTLPRFALALEEFLDAPVMVDDSLLAATFDIELQGEYDNPDALIAAVRDQLGLELTRSVS
jgi:ClpA/ClpB-like protein/uncharacterized protein DUF3738